MQVAFGHLINENVRMYFKTKQINGMSDFSCLPVDMSQYLVHASSMCVFFPVIQLVPSRWTAKINMASVNRLTYKYWKLH